MSQKELYYAQLADQTARHVTGDWQRWTGFLSTAARLYKYSYLDQLMIYAQRPDATACASYDIWNDRMNRYVKRGSKGGVSNRTVKENQKGKSVYAPLDEMLDILISQGQNDYKPEQKQLLRLEDSLIFSENICSAVPMSEYNGASRH